MAFVIRKPTPTRLPPHLWKPPPVVRPCNPGSSPRAGQTQARLPPVPTLHLAPHHLACGGRGCGRGWITEGRENGGGPGQLHSKSQGASSGTLPSERGEGRTFVNHRGRSFREWKGRAHRCPFRARLPRGDPGAASRDRCGPAPPRPHAPSSPHRPRRDARPPRHPLPPAGPGTQAQRTERGARSRPSATPPGPCPREPPSQGGSRPRPPRPASAPAPAPASPRPLGHRRRRQLGPGRK